MADFRYYYAIERHNSTPGAITTVVLTRIMEYCDYTAIYFQA